MNQVYYGITRVIAWPELSVSGEHGPEPEDGYAVMYSDGSIVNVPKDDFEAEYQPMDAMDFGRALHALKEGPRVARAGWNGKNMWLTLINPYAQYDQFRVVESSGMQGTLTTHPWMKTADNKLVPWLCSLTDMMAGDWQVLGDLERP